MSYSGRPRKVESTASDLLLSIGSDYSTELMEEILRLGVDVRDEYDRTPLVLASFKGNTRLVEELINNHANLNLQDRFGYSALHAAVSGQSIETVLLLLNQGVDIELRDKYGNTALWTAALIPRNELRIETVLLEYGANLNNMNTSGRTPGMMIETIYGSEIATKLRKKDI